MELIIFFFFPGNKMSVNPWKVETIQAFYFFNCPECAFKTKTEDMFKMHAFRNHPLSRILFEKSITTKVTTEAISESELEQVAKEDHKTLEELMYSEFGPPEPLGNQFDHSYAAKKVDTTDYIKEFLPIEEIIHSENNDIDVTSKYTNSIIQNKPTIMSEGLKVNNNATIIDNTVQSRFSDTFGLSENCHYIEAQCASRNLNKKS